MMYGLSISEIESTISEINNDIYRSTKGVEYFYLTVTSSGEETIVKFLDLVLWYSEDDMRELDEDTNTYEHIGTYLRRTLSEDLKKLSKINL